jgi:putative toxin-antitoxin system antitoxin component (TIGR02293 family)
MGRNTRLIRKAAPPLGVPPRRAGARTVPLPPAPPPREYVGALLGIPAPDTPALIRRVRQGFPFAALQRLQQAFALSTDEVGALVQIPARTLTRRKGSGRLKADESDRLLRAARLMHRAAALFNNDPGAAKAWMTTPQRSLGGAVPLELAGTEVGAREVEDALGRIEDGVFA